MCSAKLFKKYQPLCYVSSVEPDLENTMKHYADNMMYVSSELRLQHLIQIDWHHGEYM